MKFILLCFGSLIFLFNFYVNGKAKRVPKGYLGRKELKGFGLEEKLIFVQSEVDGDDLL